MKGLLLLLLALSATAPVLAQHQGHETEEAPLQTVQPPSDPPAGHDVSVRPQGQLGSPDPHAGHDMDTAPPEEQQPGDPHAGHDMSAAPQEQQKPADPHADHDMGAVQQPASPKPEAPPPPAAFSGPAHAADLLFDPQSMAAAREQLRAEQGAVRSYLFLADRFEGRSGDGTDKYLWDVQGWYGSDINRLWYKSEGEGAFDDDLETAELQVLYGRAISPFFDVQAGIRHDFSPDPERSHFVVGLQGLVPYGFEVDAAAFLSDEGDLTGRLEGEFDLQITQRVILQPRLELNVSAQDIPELGTGSGFSSAEAGLRLRYEIRREFAPYLGVGWERKLGDTGDFASAAGEDRGGWDLVLGIRSWF